jgi:hypothetical protein
MTTVKTWAHGDRPIHTELNTYAAALNEAHTQMGDIAWNWLYPKGAEATFTGLHVHRYLKFQSSGEIKDPSGINAPVSISEDDTGFGIYDLDQVKWLTYGSLYTVTGVSVCCEDWMP